jgi:hypothetical protein
VTGTLPDRFVVSQNVSISDTFPVARMTDPVGTIPFKDLYADPSSFFLNSYAVNKLNNTVLAGWAEKYATVIDDMVKKTMTMILAGENKVQIRYHGRNRELGEILVGFYSDRLLKKALEGGTRSGHTESFSKPEISGLIEIREEKALWRPERLKPFLVCCLVSVILVLIFLGILEWSDPSFKSERQIARYTGLPILGSIPDLNRVALLIRSSGGSPD